jgi:BASS family bile acid:Na+ symporter
MAQLVEIAIPVITFLLMLAVGLDLTPGAFARVRRRPVLVIAGIVGPTLLLPPIALLLVATLAPAPQIATGLLLIASCPVGGISNVYSYLARASTALSVTLTAVSCLLAAATIPLLTRGFEWALGRPLGFAVPWQALAAQLSAVIVLPVAAGMIIRRAAPDWTARRDRQVRAWGFIALAALIAFVIVDQRRDFLLQIRAMTAVTVAMTVAAMAAGAAVAFAVRADPRDRFTLAVEFATRNVAVAVAIAVALLGDARLAVFATTYFLVEIPIMLAAVAAFRASAAAG